MIGIVIVFYIVMLLDMFVLIDAVGTLVSGDQDLTFETRELNTELADYLATLDVQIVVTSNARGERGKRIRDLMSGYSFEYFSFLLLS